MKNRLLLFVLSVVYLTTSCSSLLGIRYAYAPVFGPGAGEAHYSVFSDGRDSFISVSLSSDGPIFLSVNPTISFQNFEGERLVLNGISLGNTTPVIVSDNTTNYVAAQFRVAPEQIDFFRSGIRSVQITTIPIVHEVTFKKDRIGRKLYQELLRRYATF